METVFVVQHARLSSGNEDVKFLGVYSSRESADGAVRRFEKLPGFADSPDGFSIDEYFVDRDYWEQGFG